MDEHEIELIRSAYRKIDALRKEVKQSNSEIKSNIIDDIAESLALLNEYITKEVNKLKNK